MTPTMTGMTALTRTPAADRFIHTLRKLGRIAVCEMNPEQQQANGVRNGKNRRGLKKGQVNK